MAHDKMVFQIGALPFGPCAKTGVETAAAATATTIKVFLIIKKCPMLR
jgi:hypothetical protein